MTSTSEGHNHPRRERGFTFIELIIVILVASALLLLGIGTRSTAKFWRQQSAIRELSETLRFLFHQSIADQIFYRVEFDLENNSYKVGVIRPEPESDERFQEIAQDAGRISLELNAFLNPSAGETHTFIPPPSMPSLGEEKRLPDGLTIEKIYTPLGWFSKQEAEKVRVHFSPRGFAEFTVLHILRGEDKEFTLVNNPFTGLTRLEDGFKEYEWTYNDEEG